MGMTLLQKILYKNSGKIARSGDIIDVNVDARVARDFGGANVVKNLNDNGLSIDDASKTFFTFDCNPGGSDQKYAANQQICRDFAREAGIGIYDIDQGIGTHIGIDEGLVKPGEVFVSTDSHANIMGSIGAFGQGMGDVDIAAAFSKGSVWFKVPRSMKLVIKGMPGDNATPKDVTLKMLQHLGANGLLGYAAEIQGEYMEQLNLSGRITISSMCTEMGGIIVLFPPNDAILKELGMEMDLSDLLPDDDAIYDKILEIDITGIGPMISRPGHPEDVVDLDVVKGEKIGSAFIGSCTNGRYSDLKAAANVMKGRKIAPGVVLKIVPSTRKVWERCLEEGLMRTFMEAGALVGNSGCAGCAAGQIGQNGPGEVTISTGNRNYKGKQGKGAVFLSSPETVASSAIAGYITSIEDIPDTPREFKTGSGSKVKEVQCAQLKEQSADVFRGKAWFIPMDNIDTDMIYHNRYLTITDIKEMGQYAFDNLEGYEDFSKKVNDGDIVIVGKNFGAGSSRQQAVDCFKALGVSIILAESFGAIYERNAINGGMPIMTYEGKEGHFSDGDDIEVDIRKGSIRNLSKGFEVKGEPFSDVQMDIYRRGGLLVRPCGE